MRRLKKRSALRPASREISCSTSAGPVRRRRRGLAGAPRSSGSTSTRWAGRACRRYAARGDRARAWERPRRHVRRGGSSPSSLWYGPNPSVRFCGQLRLGAGPPREPRFCPERSVERPRSPLFPDEARGGRPSPLLRGRSDPEPWLFPFAGGRPRRGEPSLLVPDEARGGRPSLLLRGRSDPWPFPLPFEAPDPRRAESAGFRAGGRPLPLGGRGRRRSSAMVLESGERGVIVPIPEKQAPPPLQCCATGAARRNPGGDLLSRRVSPQVPSALAVFTSVFGMGTGVSPPQ